jgi:hypothetical protein
MGILRLLFGGLFGARKAEGGCSGGKCGGGGQASSVASAGGCGSANGCGSGGCSGAGCATRNSFGAFRPGCASGQCNANLIS